MSKTKAPGSLPSGTVGPDKKPSQGTYLCNDRGLAMNGKAIRAGIRKMFHIRAGLLPLVIFTLLLGVANVLVVNQRVVLYMFYIPVIIAAWWLPKRHAVGVATLAALMMIAYALFRPDKMVTSAATAYLWTELVIWGGILVITAYVVCTLSAKSNDSGR